MQTGALLWISLAAVCLPSCARSDGWSQIAPAQRPSGASGGAPAGPYNVTPPMSGKGGSGGWAGSASSAGRAAGGSGGGGAGGFNQAGGSTPTGPVSSFGGSNANGNAGTNSAGGSRTQNMPSAAGGALVAASGGAGPSTAGAASGGTLSSGGAATNAGPPKDCAPETYVLLKDGRCVPRIVEFAVGTQPTSIALGADDTLWFDDGKANRLVNLDQQGRVRDSIQLTGDPTQRELIRGSGNAILWFTDYTAKTVTELPWDGPSTEYKLEFSPSGLTLGPDNAIWLTELGKAVHRLVPGENPSIESFEGGPSNTIIVGPDKNLWFPTGSNLSRMSPDGTNTPFSITDGYISDLCSGPDGALWYVDNWFFQVGRIETDGRLRTIDLPKASNPQRIVSGPDGALWFTEEAAGTIGRISLDGERLTHYPTPTIYASPHALTVGPDRNIWFTESSSGKIGRLIPDPPAN